MYGNIFSTEIIPEKRPQCQPHVFEACTDAGRVACVARSPCHLWQVNVLVIGSRDKTSRESVRKAWEIVSLADWATGWVLTVGVDRDDWLTSWLDTVDACLAGKKKQQTPAWLAQGWMNAGTLQQNPAYFRQVVKCSLNSNYKSGCREHPRAQTFICIAQLWRINTEKRCDGADCTAFCGSSLKHLRRWTCATPIKDLNPAESVKPACSKPPMPWGTRLKKIKQKAFRSAAEPISCDTRGKHRTWSPTSLFRPDRFQLSNVTGRAAF